MKFTRQPWQPPLGVSLSNIWDWTNYQFGMKMFGLGLKERRLLIKATDRVFQSRSSQVISGWEYEHDPSEVLSERLLVRLNMKEKTCLTLHAWDGVGVVFSFPNGDLYPDQIMTLYLPGMTKRSRIISQIVHKRLDRLRKIEYGVNSLWVPVRFQEVDVEQLTITELSCQASSGSFPMIQKNSGPKTRSS